MTKLELAGHQAWLVGSTRDLYLGLPPHDWDLTTDALPEEICKVFAGQPLNRAGEKFGTISLTGGDKIIDVTTFRKDGQYRDHRRPDSVAFSRDLFEDLKRRDFTVNAIVYSPTRGVRDYFCGKRDLKKKLIRAIGNAQDRFEEDAIRILRALRFASVLDFSVEERTAEAIHKKKELLSTLPTERILPEWNRMLCGRNVKRVLTEFSDVIGVLVPEILPAIGFDQLSPFHQYDVWMHTVNAVAASVPVTEVRLALLFHDISKPSCLTVDPTGRGHFYGHHKKSARIAKEVMERMRFPVRQIRAVTELVTYHDSHPKGRADVKKLLSLLGESRFRMLVQVMEADILAHSKWTVKRRLVNLENIRDTAEQILSSGECYTLEGLAIKGNDLTGIGLAGPAVGEALNYALNKVIRGEWENDRESLLAGILSLREKKSEGQ
ncbi:MAG: HD domain-containing protein [Clostridia bacterium]|nr:HD domain-containing protein [Clostridia bacterium]